MPTDGVYLVNCTLGNEQRSGLAYYSTIITNGGNDGHQPDAFAYVNEGGFIHWEGSEQFGIFPDGRKFDWIIDPNGASTTLGTVVGTASNGIHTFQVFRDTDALLVTTLDGFAAHKIYLCN